MTKRFRKIQGMIKMAAKMGIAVGEDNNIKAYFAYRDGTSTDYKTTPQPRGSSAPFTLLPFVSADFTTRYASKMSGRAFNNMATLTLTETELNIDTGTAEGATSTTGARVSGYSPAKVIVTLSLQTPVEKKSGILLLEYKRTTGESYTFPFGKRNANGKRNYPEMTGYLLKEIGKGSRVVSFKPEVPA